VSAPASATTAAAVAAAALTAIDVAGAAAVLDAVDGECAAGGERAAPLRPLREERHEIEPAR
jgi:hypothetical protein